jgi:hypothetical protein
MKARRAIVTAAPKGGIGKTFLAKVLFDLLVASGRAVAAWDLDSATGTFAVYDDAIKTFDLHGSRDTYSWLDDCYRDDVDDVIIDVPGGRIDELLRTFGDNSIEAFVSAVRSSGRELVIVNPIGVMIAETVTAQVVLNAFAGTSARVVIASVASMTLSSLMASKSRENVATVLLAISRRALAPKRSSYLVWHHVCWRRSTLNASA